MDTGTDKNKALVIIDEDNNRDSQETIWDNIQYFFEKGYDVVVKLIKGTDDASALIDEYADDIDLVVCEEDEERLDQVLLGMVKNGLSLPVWMMPASV